MSIQFQSKYLRETQVKEETGAANAGAYAANLGATEKKYKGPEMTEDAPMLAHGKADIHTLTQDGMKRAKRGTPPVKGVIVKDLWEDDYTNTDADDAKKDDEESININEAHNYHQFKKEAATRTKSQQMHEAAKMIHKKLEEINRLLEYTSQMKNELAEGEEQLEYKHNTKKVFEKINTKVIETYSRVKKLK